MTIAAEFEELPGSPQEKWTATDFSATMRILVPWAVRNRTALEFWGKYYERIPETKAMPVSIGVRPFEAKISEQVDHEGYASYEKAELTIEYSNGSNSQEGGGGSETPADWLEESIEPVVEILPMGAQRLYFDSALKRPAAESMPFGRQICTLAYKVTLYGCRNIPYSCFDLLGHVNMGPTASYTLGYVFYSGCLLYTGFAADRRITSEGTEGWALHFTFMARNRPWNWVWDPEYMDFRPVYVKIGKSKQGIPYYHYPPANISIII